MVTFDVFVKRMNKLDNFVNKVAPELLLKNEKEIVDLNNAQLMAGKNTDSETMQRGYSTQYGKKRRKAGLQTSFVDLKFSGAYQDSRKGKKSSKGINIISDVDYEKYLRGNFPGHVGLNKVDSNFVAKMISKPLAILIKKYLIA